MESLRRVSIQSQASSLYRSEPVDCPEDVGEFVNAAMVLQVASSVSPQDLLLTLQGMEADHGRRRGAEQNQARTLDLDIITFKNQVLESENLVLPHPRAVQRRFVLQPLAELEPNMVLPGHSLSVSELLADLPAVNAVSVLD